MSRPMRSATRSNGRKSPTKSRQSATVTAARGTSPSGERQTAAVPTKAPSRSLRSQSAVHEDKPNDNAARSSGPFEADSEEDSDGISLNESDFSDDVVEQLSALDHDLMLDNLPLLYDDAKRILALFKSTPKSNLIEELKSTETSLGRRFKQLQSRFHVSLQPFRLDDGFISTPLVIRKLAGTGLPLPFAARPDNLIYMANLAIFACDAIADQGPSKLDLLANSFPDDQILGNFGPSNLVSTGNQLSPLDPAIIDLAVSLRTQYFIGSVAKHQHVPSFDPDDLLRQAFYDEEGKVLGFEEQMDHVLEGVTDAYNARISQIRSCFSKSSKAPVNLKKLEALFPYSTFLTSLVSWVNHRQDELKEKVAAAGGAQTISDVLLELSTGEPEVVEDRPRGSISLPQGPDRTSAQMSKRMQQLRNIKARREAEDVSSSDETEQDAALIAGRESPTSPTSGTISARKVISATRDDGLQSMSHDARFEPPFSTQGSVVPSQNTAKILAASNRQAAQSNKENRMSSTMAHRTRDGPNEPVSRFLDKQKGAKRIQWSGNFDDEREVDEDEDEDDDFEVDTRRSKKAKLGGTFVAKNPTSGRVMSRDVQPTDIGQGDDEDEDDNGHNDLLGTSTKRYLPPPSSQPVSSRSPLSEVRRRSRSKLPSSSAPPARSQSQGRSTSSDFPMATQIAQVNRQAKEAVRYSAVVSAPLHAIKTQVRRAWSPAETERLIDLIALHGSAWSTILKTDADFEGGPELQGRSQVQLKDKARNLKVDYLKASLSLPPGFEYVKIKASEVEKLESMGRRAHGGPARDNPRRPEVHDDDNDDDAEVD